MKLTNKSSSILLLSFFFTLLLTNSAFQSDELIADDEEFGRTSSPDSDVTVTSSSRPQQAPPATNTIRKRSTDSESDSRVQFDLQHAFGDSSDFSAAGTFTARLKTSALGGQVVNQPASLFSPADLSEDELRALLLSRLMSRKSTLSPADATLANLLRYPSSYNETPCTLRDLEALEERLLSKFAILEQSCRPQAQGLKRKHDDPESDDHPEGEKRLKVLETGVLQSVDSSENIVIYAASSSGQQQQQQQETEFDDDVIYDGQPFQMIEALPMIGFEEVIDLDWYKSMTVEKPEVGTNGSERVQSDDAGYLDNEFNDWFYQNDNLHQENFQPEILNNIPSPLEENVDNMFDQITDVQEESAVPSVNKKRRKMSETVSKGEFFKNIKEEVNLKHAINRKVLRFPFLEEAAWKIFSKRISVLKNDRLLGLDLINERFHIEYKFLIKTQQQKLDKVRFDQPNSVIRKISSDRISTFVFPRFEVYRKSFEDVNDYFSFSEADFSLLTLKDILKIYDHCMMSIRKPKPVQLAKRAIVRFMKTMIDVTVFQDFQSGKKRINLTKPNQFLEGLENHHLCDVIEEPELGVVLQNGEMKRIFIRCNELNKYSSGTSSRTPTFSEDIGGVEIGDEEGVKPLVERSFWAKYWMYLVPLGLVVMNAVTQAMNMPEEQASGQAGAQPQQAVGAVPRGQGAAVWRR